MHVQLRTKLPADMCRPAHNHAFATHATPKQVEGLNSSDVLLTPFQSFMLNIEPCPAHAFLLAASHRRV